MGLVIGGLLAYFFVPFPWWVLIVVALAGVEVFEVMVWLRWRRRRSITGIGSMVGERGVLAPGGRRIRIRGTSYPARVLEGEAGDAVVVEDVEGMTLVVRRAPLRG